MPEKSILQPQPNLQEKSLLSIIEDHIIPAIEWLTEEVPEWMTFQDYMNIYTMIPYYKDVVIAVEEYMFAKTEA